MFAETTLWHGAWAMTAIWAWVFAIGISWLFIGMVLSECAIPAGLFILLLAGFGHLVGAVDIGVVLANPLWLLAWLVPYLVCGLAFCFYRYRFWLRRQLSEDKSYYPNHSATPDFGSDYKPSRQLDRLATWSLFWPVCLLRLALGDWLTTLVRYIINDVFGKFFRQVWESEVNRLKSKSDTQGNQP